MKAVLQRVQQASVHLQGHSHSAIGPGLLVLLGIEQNDGLEDLKWIARKITNLRIFEHPEKPGKIDLSLQQTRGELLLVSQFTLLAECRKGNRPSFTGAADPERAEQLYLQTATELERLLEKPIATGKFAAHMEVNLLNDGPFTLWLDSLDRPQP